MTATYKNISVKFNLTVKSGGSIYTKVYFRGTPNAFGKTEMTYSGNNIWEIRSIFGTASDERFKVDVSGNWTEAYPSQDYMVKDGAGEYRIIFNEITKNVRAYSKDEIVPTDISRNRLMVAIGYGQSISSNNAPTKYTCAKNVYNFDIYTNKFYKAKDPMRCADSTGGSVWSRLGDKMIEKGMYDNVIMVTIGVNGSPISRWTKGGDLNPKLVTAINAIQGAGFNVTHIFWHQGSSDADQYANTSKDQYKSRFYDMLNIIRNNGVKAPIYVSVHTGNGDFNSNTQDIKNKRLAIQAAQRELVNGVDIFAGPDTDTYVPNSMRQSDGLHFNDAGYEKFRDMWIESITASKK